MASDEAVSVSNRRQSLGVAIIGLGAAGMLLLIALTPSVFYEKPTSIGFRVAAGLGAAGLVLWAARLARARVVVTPRGVEIRNAFRCYSFSWDEVERFRLGSWSFHTRIGLLELKGGRTIPMIGITGPHPAPWVRDRTVNDLVDDLEGYRLYHLDRGRRP